VNRNQNSTLLETVLVSLRLVLRDSKANQHAYCSTRGRAGKSSEQRHGDQQRSNTVYRNAS
jgi:hypothetical protein